MRRGFFGSLAGLLLGTGLALAQAPVPSANVVNGGSSPYWPNPERVAPFAAPPSTPQPLPTAEPPVATAAGPGPLLFWADPEALWWFVKHGPVAVPLVTTGPPGSLGVLGRNGVTAVIGNQAIDYQDYFGGRINFGGWFGPAQLLGFEADFFLLEDRQKQFDAAGPGGSPVVARPFVDSTTGQNAVDLVSLPGSFSGHVTVSSSSNLWGAEANLVAMPLPQCDGPLSLILLAGFRFVDLEEHLDVSQTKTLLPGIVQTNPDGTQVVVPGGVANFGNLVILSPNLIGVQDSFAVRNKFYGGQVGARARFQWANLSVSTVAKVALGSTDEVLTINGVSSLPSGLAAPFPAGLLATAGNSGRFQHHEFSVIPEVGLNLGYQFTPQIRAVVGYTFLYWSDVARPGNQIDPVVNPVQVPTSAQFVAGAGPTHPPAFRQSDFWAQGVNLGFEFSF